MALNSTPTYSVTPSSVKAQTQSNYISLFDYTSVYKPDVHSEIAHIYGKQSISGMLHLLGSESSFDSDQYIWTEEGRLHTIYTTVTRAGNVFTQPNHVFRLYETVHISDGNAKAHALIVAVDNDTFEVASYKTGGLPATLGTTGLKVFVTGSEHGKGTSGAEGTLTTDLTHLSNKPIILKDRFDVSGSDATQVGWVETDNGEYLWYLQSEKDGRRRWEDRLELSMLLGQKAEAGSEASAAGKGGTEGVFEAVQKRGNVFQGVADQLADWDSIIKRFDAQGKIQDYTFYVDRDQSLAIDNLLGSLNAGYDGGISYGIFENDKDMAVDLGFKGFTRGTYNIFKTDSRLFNDPALLGAVDGNAGKIRGLLIPVGTSEVYKGEYNGMSGGEKITTPFLQSKYRMAGSENRKYKTWITGSVGGVSTNSNDAMEVHRLSERMLCTVGANNFMLFEGN